MKYYRHREHKIYKIQSAASHEPVVEGSSKYSPSIIPSNPTTADNLGD